MPKYVFILIDNWRRIAISNRLSKCIIWSSHSCSYESCKLLRYSVVKSVYESTIRRNVSPLSSRPKISQASNQWMYRQNSDTLFRNVGSHTDCIALHPSRRTFKMPKVGVIAERDFPTSRQTLQLPTSRLVASGSGKSAFIAGNCTVCWRSRRNCLDRGVGSNHCYVAASYLWGMKTLSVFGKFTKTKKTAHYLEPVCRRAHSGPYEII
jgi:hypothetical protein